MNDQELLAKQTEILDRFCQETGAPRERAAAFAVEVTKLAMDYVIQQPISREELRRALAEMALAEMGNLNDV